MATISKQRYSIKVIGQDSHVSPPPNSVPTTTLPLTFFDIMHIGSSRFAYKCLCFYETQNSTSQFMQTTLPNLKKSLSIALQHFFPFAGNLVFPPPPKTPYILYTQGDSVSFIVRESTADFNHLIRDNARHFHDFEDLVPELPPATSITSNANTGNYCMVKPIMAIQVTVFPNLGISLGGAFCHAAADGKTVAHFLRSWQSIHKSGGEYYYLSDNIIKLPCYNRDILIKDPLGLATIFMNNKWQLRRSSNIDAVITDKFRVTYGIKHSQVMLLKDWVRKKYMELEENINKADAILWMSTMVVTCAYLWVCLIKSQEIISDALISHFVFPVDYRDILQIPATYFGNCLMLRFTSAKKSDLVGENGILVAATAIGREIMNFVRAPLKEMENGSFLKNFDVFNLGKDVILLTGSPKFGVYKRDFGFGRLRKFEVGNFDSSVAISYVSITDSKEEVDVEFGLAFAPIESDRFDSIFYGGLTTMDEIYEKSPTVKEKTFFGSKI